MEKITLDNAVDISKRYLRCSRTICGNKSCSKCNHNYTPDELKQLAQFVIDLKKGGANDFR